MINIHTVVAQQRTHVLFGSLSRSTTTAAHFLAFRYSTFCINNEYCTEEYNKSEEVSFRNRLQSDGALHTFQFLLLPTGTVCRNKFELPPRRIATFIVLWIPFLDGCMYRLLAKSWLIRLHRKPGALLIFDQSFCSPPNSKIQNWRSVDEHQYPT